MVVTLSTIFHVEALSWAWFGLLSLGTKLDSAHEHGIIGEGAAPWRARHYLRIFGTGM